MIYPLARNVAVGSVADAVRLAIPTWSLLSKRRMRALANTTTHDERDTMVRRWSRQVLQALDVNVTATGLDHISGGPFLVAALHEGLMDAPLLVDQLGLPMTFVARAELAAEVPLGRFLTASSQILIKPEAPSQLRALLRGTSLTVAQGRSVVMFPQGSVLGIEIEFRQGAWIVAHRLNLPILPVVITGTGEVWQHPFAPDLKRHVNVSLEVLEPRHIESAEQYRQLERMMKSAALANEHIPPRRYVPARDGFWDGYSFEIDDDFEELAAEVEAHRIGSVAAAEPTL